VKNPKISLLTCTYYRPDLLRRAILSVQNQEFEDYEHLIISDHCPFAESVYNEFKGDNRIKFLRTPSPHIYNLGACAFNKGIEEANSNYISYLLDDDILYPNHLREHYEGLKNNKVFHTLFDNIEFKEPTNTVKNILSKSYTEICDMALNLRQRDGLRPHSFDVGALCHEKNIPTKWIPQSLQSGWEDSEFIKELKITSKHEVYTTIKVNWGGIHRKNSKGLDSEYYNLLMGKLVVNKNSYGGFQLINQPYVYPELKNTLYEK
jgi:glycosyltransferase involved in cell wall biosynthesis